MSQQGLPLRTETVTSVAAVTTRRFVGFDGAQAATQGQKVLGVARFGVGASGFDFPVDCIGSAIVETGAAIAAGASIISDNQGRAIPSTGKLAVAAGAVAVTSAAANGVTDLVGGDTPEFVVADALPGQSASAAGQFIEILFRR